MHDVWGGTLRLGLSAAVFVAISNDRCDCFNVPFVYVYVCE